MAQGGKAKKDDRKSAPEAFGARYIKIKELEEQITSFGLCLSALTVLNGEKRDDGNFEYVLRLEDFQAISESNVFIETEPDIDGAPGTRVLVKLKANNGSN